MKRLVIAALVAAPCLTGCDSILEANLSPEDAAALQQLDFEANELRLDLNQTRSEADDLRDQLVEAVQRGDTAAIMAGNIKADRLSSEWDAKVAEYDAIGEEIAEIEERVLNPTKSAFAMMIDPYIPDGPWKALGTLLAGTLGARAATKRGRRHLKNAAKNYGQGKLFEGTKDILWNMTGFGSGDLIRALESAIDKAKAEGDTQGALQLVGQLRAAITRSLEKNHLTPAKRQELQAKLVDIDLALGTSQLPETV